MLRLALSALAVAPLLAAPTSFAVGAGAGPAPGHEARSADDNPSSAPGAAKAGKVYQWKAKDGLAFEYRVPKGYDPEVGANLTLVLHGNGLDHRWTFWNHPQDEFRPDDLVVSPDGTTAHSGTGANEFLAGANDVARVKALILELKATWNVRQVFLYGHSQGAFFVYLFAGAEPDLVDGVVGHAGGVWNGTDAPKKAQHQAIGFLHGTNDHIPYGQAVGGRTFYEERKYPLVHLRTLFGWDHRPHWYQAAQVLAWCEGMTSADPARVAAAAEDLADTKRPMGVDWSALRAVAARLQGLEGASAAQSARGVQLVRAVDELADKYVDSIVKDAGKRGFAEFSPGGWSCELARFLEVFYGTPAADALVKKHSKQLEAVREAGSKARRAAYAAIEKDSADALDEAITLIEDGYLDPAIAETLTAVDKWLEETKARLPKKSRARYEELARAWRKAQDEGARDFDQRAAKTKL
ncbi:MAG: hypothetical protein R3F49_05630 [Planctomycetota bacterium]